MVADLNVAGMLGNRTLARHLAGASFGEIRLITDEGVAVGGAFDSDAATGMMPVANRVAGVLGSRRS